jgi:hypothetical protein
VLLVVATHLVDVLSIQTLLGFFFQHVTITFDVQHHHVSLLNLEHCQLAKELIDNEWER